MKSALLYEFKVRGIQNVETNFDKPLYFSQFEYQIC